MKETKEGEDEKKLNSETYDKGKGKGQPIRGHEGPEGE
jgi:hypothetical protein